MTNEETIDVLKDMKGVFGTRSHNQYSLPALDLAIQALEKQIPKKPYLDKSDERILYKCSNCKRIRITKWDDSLRSGIETEFCPHCGQKFNWSDTND